MDFNPLNDRPKRAEVTSKPPASVSYTDKSHQHLHNQDAVTNLEFSCTLENGTEIQVSLAGVFDTTGSLVDDKFDPKLYGATIAVKYINNKITEYLNALSQMPDVKNYALSFKRLLPQLLKDIHKKIVEQGGAESCGCICATIISGDDKFVVISNCGDTRSYFYLPKSQRIPQVPTLDHSLWLAQEEGKIINAFINFRGGVSTLTQDEKTKLQRIVANQLKNYQVVAYSAKRFKEHTITIDRYLDETLGGKEEAFKYRIHTFDYWTKSNMVTNTLGAEGLDPELSTFATQVRNKTIIISCTDGLYEIIPFEEVQTIIDTEYRENDPLALSKISVMIKNKVVEQQEVNKAKNVGLFVKPFDDFGFCIQVV